MIIKWIKMGALATAGLCLVGGLLFGREMVSYVTTSAGSVRGAIKNAVPIEFELQRARNLVDEIIPEMHANLRLIAQEEVEVASLKSDINHSRQSLDQEKNRVQKLASLVTVHQANYTLGDRRHTRQQLKEDLARRFDQFKEAEIVLAGKERLLTTRENSLQLAIQRLERTRSQKVLLVDKIETLEGKHRLLKAASVGSGVQLDDSKLAQTEKLIRQIKKRLDIAERVLSHEAKFIQPIALDTINEKDLLQQVNEHFARPDDSNLLVGKEDNLQLTQIPKNQ